MREFGYYWVVHTSQLQAWEIGWFYAGLWYIMGREDGIPEADVFEIGPRLEANEPWLK